MKKSILLLVLIFNCLHFYGQRIGKDIVIPGKGLSSSIAKNLKSIYKTQNDTIVGIQLFDRQGKIIFEKTSQIIEDWNNELLSWMYAFQYNGEDLVYEYYAHSNINLQMTYYDDSGKEYSKTISKFGNRNPFSEINDINTPDELISYLNRQIPVDMPFQINHSESQPFSEYFSSHTDSNKIVTKEYWTIEEDDTTHRTIKKYDLSNNLIYLYKETPYNSSVNEYVYNKNGTLIEEIEKYDLDDSDSFQRKVYSYQGEKLIKTDFFHGNNLAFTYEYFYNGSLLTKEVITRITESEHFKNRKKQEIIEYKYEFYD